jgi:hypothetical protein
MKADLSVVELLAAGPGGCGRSGVGDGAVQGIGALVADVLQCLEAQRGAVEAVLVDAGGSDIG